MKTAKKDSEIELYLQFCKKWKKEHSISRPPSFISWKVHYKDNE